ncbi:MAG: hypothetical protein KatS3mg102_0166 [Planctomycetota bacterium]|nr:MAG: hypothetical protein KatS3mg102_0166 [Planctomycetota bacterium]
MVWRFVVEGGWAMVPILACSVVALALLLERTWYWLELWWHRDPELAAALERLEAVDRARAARSRDPVCRVLLAARERPDDLAPAAQLAERLLENSRATLPLLHVIGGVASTLGLFGTVLGVSLAFEHTIATGRLSELAGSLSVALNTTMLGLIVYVPCYLGGSLFQMLTNRTAFAIEQRLGAMRARLRRTGPLAAVPPLPPAGVAAASGPVAGTAAARESAPTASPPLVPPAPERPQVQPATAAAGRGRSSEASGGCNR